MALLEIPRGVKGDNARYLALYSAVHKFDMMARQSPTGDVPEPARASAYEALIRYAGVADHQGEAHVRRVGDLARDIAVQTGWMPEYAESLRVAAALHDAGKVALPRSLLEKQGPLSESERGLLEQHTWFGYHLFGQPHWWLLDLAREIALSHHERWDGNGYPRGRSDVHNAEGALIVALADAYETLTCPGPHTEGVPPGEAIEILTRDAEGAFDPFHWEAFLELRDTGLLEARRVS